MSEIPVEELLVQIQRHLDARQGARSETAGRPLRGDRFSEPVYDALEEASAVLEAIRVEPSLTPPHLPLVGGLWQGMRARAHELVVFYVNRLAGVQATFNREVVAALSALIRDLDRGGRADSMGEIAALRQEVAVLRSQITAMQPASGDPAADPVASSADSA